MRVTGFITKRELVNVSSTYDVEPLCDDEDSLQNMLATIKAAYPDAIITVEISVAIYGATHRG